MADGSLAVEHGNSLINAIKAKAAITKAGATPPDAENLNIEDNRKQLIIDAVQSFTEFSDLLLLLEIEQYQFIKILDEDLVFKSQVKSCIGKMLFQVNKNPDNKDGAEILRGWLKIINEGMSFNTATMMYVNILNSSDDYTYNEEYWKTPEGISTLNSLREYIVSTEDYITFCQLYFKRVLKKQLIMMPYIKVLADFYVQVFRGKRKRFIVNMPVRHGKTEFLDALVFFFYICDPKSMVLHSAYGETVLKPMRDRIETALNVDPFFKALMNLSTNAAFGRFNTTDFATIEGGEYKAFTINSPATGRGGNALDPDQKGMLALDDVNAPKWKGTQHMINANETVVNTLLSRIPHMPLLNNQQRIGDDDLTAFLLEDSNTNPPEAEAYRLLVCYIPFEKNQDTDDHFKELKRRYPNVDWFGYDQMDYGVINPKMAHYANKETCPEAWHIYLTQYQQIPTELADKLFHSNMFIPLRKDEVATHATTGLLMDIRKREDGHYDAMPYTLLFHVDTSQLSEHTEGSDYSVISVFGVCVDPYKKVKRAVLFEQWMKQDIGIKELSRGFEIVATKWLSSYPKNDIRLAVEEKAAGSVARTSCEGILSTLAIQYNVSSVLSLDLKRPPGESKRYRGEQASQLIQNEEKVWFRYYPYDIETAVSTKFTNHGTMATIKPDHWFHECKYQLVNFTGRESKVFHDDCCEGFFDVANKMIIDAGEWREFVTYSSSLMTEDNILKA